MSNSISVSGGTAFIALSLLATISAYYLFHDRRFTLSERLYFLICKRNIEEALLEHELLEQRKYKRLHFFANY
jgi:hypothetical protein